VLELVSADVANVIIIHTNKIEIEGQRVFGAGWAIVRVLPMELKRIALWQAVFPDGARAVEYVRVFGDDVLEVAVAVLDQIAKAAGTNDRSIPCDK
jgi:hypothetical protein